MIVELGHFCLILAFLTAIVQSAAGMARPHAAHLTLARRAAMAQCALVAAAFAALVYSFVVSDFSVDLVVRNSHTLKPLLYKIAGTWGNHEGSMVLWTLVLAGFGAMTLRQPMPDNLRARLLGVQGLQGAGVLAFILFSSNPFTRLDPAPPDGTDLNPLLQDPGLAFHPPLLYLGYVGFSIVFSFACAGLLANIIGKDWAALVRPWALAAWTGLSAGIALGSWWAYYELGWGGFWFWDPVENASLMPWLAGTALIHSLIVAQHRGALPRWTVLLALLAYTFSLLGTFLVRSGVLTSVHAFATDPARGIFILLLILIFAGGGFLLYALRAPDLRGDAYFSPVSRESAILFNNLLLGTMAATILTGTLYPMILSALDAGQISVGPPYFNATIIPLAVPLLLLMGAGPHLSWKRTDIDAIRARLTPAAILTAATAGLIYAVMTHISFVALAGLTLAAWAVMATVTELWDHRRKITLSALGMRAAHAGLGIAVAGMIGTTLWKDEQAAILKPGESMKAGAWTVTLDNVDAGFGPNYSTIMATLSAHDRGDSVTLKPERRYYPVAGTATTEAAIKTVRTGDLYVVLGQQDGDGWIIRATTHPLVTLLWGGFALVTLGGVLSLAGLIRRANGGRA